MQQDLVVVQVTAAAVVAGNLQVAVVIGDNLVVAVDCNL